MATVYVLFSPLDHEIVKHVASRLQSLGYRVAERSEAASSDVVLALWSERARQSLLIHELCADALDADKLVQATLDGAAAPRPFDSLPCANLSGDRAQYGPLEDAIAQIAAKQAPAASSLMPQLGPLTTPAVIGAPKLVLIAIIAALATFAGLLSMVQNDLISVEQLQFALAGIVAVSALCAATTGYRLWSIRRSGD